MFDPLSLIAIAGTAVINYAIKYAKEKTGEAVVSGFVGNRADAIGCSVFRSCWNSVKNIWTAGELPKNADLIRALKKLGWMLLLI